LSSYKHILTNELYLPYLPVNCVCALEWTWCSLRSELQTVRHSLRWASPRKTYNYMVQLYSVGWPQRTRLGDSNLIPAGLRYV